MKNYLMIFLLSFSALAGVDNEVFIQGKIGNEFDEKKVKVTDTLGQTYFLPRSVFPKAMKMKQGKSFAVHVSDEDLASVKPIKK